MTKVMILYPPGRAFQRGEDRCQIDIDSSLVNCSRACNDLGYMSSCLKRSGYTTFIKDYQAEKLTEADLFNDIKAYSPDVVIISITNGSIYTDLETVKKIRNIKNDMVVIFKGALFFNPDVSLFNKIDLTSVDYLIGGEFEFIIEDLLNAHFENKQLLINIQGISYRKNNNWVIQKVITFNENLDDIPFPDRSLMNNKLYINPETNRPMALITSSMGCCYGCSYCLSPVISGKKVRYRSSKNMFDEIKECVEKYNIYDFFFKSDTFTTNKEKVIELCQMLISSGLNKKINWVSTARVDTLDEELIRIMKESGCSLLAIGFESGSQESLDKMNKKTTVNQNLYAAKLCKKYNIRILGYFLIGFPWENEKHLNETKKHIFDINADYIEISVVVPYYKTPVYSEIYGDTSSEKNDILGHDSYNNIVKNYSQVSNEELIKFKKDTILKFYLRPSYIIRRLLNVKSPAVLNNYIYYGFRMLKNFLFK